MEMQYGVQLHPLGEFPGVTAIVDTAKLIEELGFGYVSFPEHTIFPVELERMLTRNWYEPLSMVSHLAAYTSTLKFFTAITVLTQHNPIALAKQAATIDVISGGRLGLGVAGGWLEQEIQWLGGNPRTRGKTLEEYIQLMRALWTQHPASFSGTKYSFENASFHPKPSGQTVPLLVGGAPRISASRAARLGDGWMPANSFDELPGGLDLLDAELERVGRTRADFPIFFELPLFDPPQGVIEYLATIDARLPESFAGDYAKAERRAGELKTLGVTHATIFPSFPDVGRLHSELRDFAERFIAE
jgi:probable F420-dependent oxidoreductase